VTRHRFDPVAFVFGGLFLGLALFVLIGGSLGEATAVWVLAIPAMVIASLIVLYAGRQLFERRVETEREDVPTDDAAG
jgi:membrane protein implicated in regulation of membrane protease activity